MSKSSKLNSQRVVLIGALSLCLLSFAGGQSQPYADQAQPHAAVNERLSDAVANERRKPLRFPKGISSGAKTENANGNLLYGPLKPGQVATRYGWAWAWVSVDWNKDGLNDFLYTGVMIPTGECDPYECPGQKYGPTVYLSKKNGTYLESSKLFRDTRKQPGLSMPAQELVADFNGDGKPDVYIIDAGLNGYGMGIPGEGTYVGYRDSYFLSQADGTWLESSETHLAEPNFVNWDHGGAAGDIDSDGDDDIVITTLDKKLLCLINDGTGAFLKRECGAVFAFGVELGDVDGDGDLDLLHAASEDAPEEYQTPTGIALNDGTGNFSTEIRLPQVSSWGEVPEVAFWDLDRDKDLDLILSRTGWLYVGTGIQIIENLGNFQFHSKFIPIVQAPSDYKPEGEGNKWNNFVEQLRFGDVDSDGDWDIVLIGGGINSPHSYKVRASILRNNGSMTFEHIMNGHMGNPVKKLSPHLFIDDRR